MAHPDLLAHAESQFRKEVIRLAPGLWTAVGFAASNVHLVEGATSVTIIDTSESTAAAEHILTEFRKLTDKPIARIIYTHSHRDHISGASVFAESDTPILASAGFKSDLIGPDADDGPAMALGRRTQAQFGIGLDGNARVSLGCGPGQRPMQGLGAGFVAPTEAIGTDTRIDLDGVTAELILAPGETADHMVVWLPDAGVLFCGDNWYHAFPNLYAIRGTAYRDFSAWASSLDRLAELNAAVLAPGHTRPVFGTANVREVLTTTGAAIRHVIDASAAAMNAGLSMDDLAATIALPEDLAAKPWLGSYYGRPDWSARAYAAGTLGWYDGNPTHLGTLSTAARARHVADLAGGTDALMQAARKTEDLQWRMELCDHLIALGEPAGALKADTMEALAELEINATARNTYLWEAKRLRAGEGPGR